MIFYPSETQSAAIRAAIEDSSWNEKEKEALKNILKFVEKDEEIERIYQTEEWIENPVEIQNPHKIVFHGRWVNGQDIYSSYGQKFMVEHGGTGYRIGKCHPILKGWKELVLTNCEGDEIRYDLRGNEFAEALREFKETGGIDGYFFQRGWGKHEDSEDASTWGPKSPDVIDWAGFPEE